MEICTRKSYLEPFVYKRIDFLLPRHQFVIQRRKFRIKMVSYEDIFAKIEAHMKKADPAAPRKHPYSFSFKITKDGKVVKVYFVDLKNLKFAVGEQAADCTITLDHEIMVKVGTGAMKASEALSKDLVQIDGQVELAMALEQFISQMNA
ncbi:uncharacterized protein LOC134833672 [Culicoides brevitarsis]|uniref:uncharacterized protein LOC134833672 n=1 Tax=Culicoides brevitarsis TaxID=469753 RepID=UPI00307B231E